VRRQNKQTSLTRIGADQACAERPLHLDQLKPLVRLLRALD
jgi:hypothetical protein